MARHHRRGRKGKGMTKGGLSSKGHRAHPFAKKGGRYSSMSPKDNMHRPESEPLVRSNDAAMANVAP